MRNRIDAMTPPTRSERKMTLEEANRILAQKPDDDLPMIVTGPLQKFGRCFEAYGFIEGFSSGRVEGIKIMRDRALECIQQHEDELQSVLKIDDQNKWPVGELDRLCAPSCLMDAILALTIKAEEK